MKTDFKLKDGRLYVHSTSLMEELWIGVLPQLEIDPADILIDAKFHKLIHGNGYFFTENDGKTETSIPTYSASFKIFSPSTSKYIYFKDEGLKIFKSKNSEITIQNYETNNNFSGEALIGVGRLCDFIENIVELNKKIHLDSVKGGEKKVINLYMKNVPSLERGHADNIKVTIDNVSIRNSGLGIVTYNKVNFDDSSIIPMYMSYIVQG